MNFSPYAFSLRQLQYAVAVADSLSFNRAADECHVSQPSLSAQIAELEQLLNATLFERDRRQVRVTTAGREIIERARRFARKREPGSNCKTLLRSNHRHAALGVIPTISP